MAHLAYRRANRRHSPKVRQKMMTSIRRQFDVPEDIHYLNCAYMAPMPFCVQEAGAAAITAKLRPWLIKPEDFFTDAEKTRDVAAAIFGCTPDCIAFGPSASYGFATVAQNVLVTARDNIVLVAEEFPSNVYIWQEKARKSGAELRIVRPKKRSDWNQSVLAAIDANTALVSIPHCHWADGFLFDLPAISDAVRQHQAVLVIDATQSLGALPLDLAVVDPDFVIASAYKWLLGPYAMAVYYISSRYHQAEPIEFNWLNRKDSHHFEKLINYEPNYQLGARRFDVGHRGSFSLMPMFGEALRLVAGWGVCNVASELKKMTSYLAAECRKLGLLVPEDGQHAPHIIGISFVQGEPRAKEALKFLAQRRVFLSQRGEWLRISPYLYNNQVDLDALLSGLAEFSSTTK